MTGIIMPELTAARQRARLHEVKAALRFCGLEMGHWLSWGVASVTVQGDYYAPALPNERGSPAVIVPAEEDGEIIDVVAVGLLSRSTKTRLGNARCLGSDWIDECRCKGTPVRIFADPLQWLAAKARGAVILDLRSACLLADTAGIVCGNDDALTHHIHQAMTRPYALPPIYVREERHAA